MYSKNDELYLYEIIRNEKLSLESKQQHVELFIESKGILSTELINNILDYNNKFFNIEFKSLLAESSYDKKRDLLSTIMFSLYRSGIRYERKYNKQINNFLNSKFKYNWSKKDSYYVGEVLYGRNIKNIILILDKFDDLKKIDLSCNHFERFGNNYKFMKYLKSRNYDFSNYNISTECDLDWFLNYFKLKFEEKNNLLDRFLYNLNYSFYLKEDIQNYDVKIKKILEYFLNSKKIKKRIKSININSIDCLIFSENKLLKPFNKYFKELRMIKLNNLKSNELKINKEFYYISSFYSDLEWSLILSGIDFKILKIESLEIENYFKNKILKEDKFIRGDIDSFFVFKHFLSKLKEKNIYHLYKKFENENRFSSFDYAYKVLEDKNKYFINFNQEDKFKLLMNSNEQSMNTLSDILSEIEKKNDKYNEGIDINFNKGYQDINICIDICKLLNSKRQYHISRDRRLETLNNKKIILDNQEYVLKYINNMEDLTNELIYFDKGLSFIVSNNNERVSNYAYIILKDNRDNSKGLLKYSTNENTIKDFLGEISNDILNINLGELYAC